MPSVMVWLWILLVIAVLCGAVVYIVAPGKSTAAQRAPFQNCNVAHRGFYKKDQSIPENSLPAFAAAAENGYGIELDVQYTSDKKVLVFHDDTLDRMTGTHGNVRDFTLAQIEQMPLKGTAYHAPLFAEMLETVAGRVPMIVEVKSRQEYSKEYLDALCTDTLALLRAYHEKTGGDYCIESFDPRVVQWVRQNAPDVLRGQLADSARSYHNEGTHWPGAFFLSRCLGNVVTRPQFIAWCPHPQNLLVKLANKMGAMMVMWTALPEHDAKALQKQYDCVIFQWYQPETHWTDAR